jgi:hypothetical protein
MSTLHKPPQSQHSMTTMRGSVLGEMHQGQVATEERHPGLKAMVRFSVVSNVLCLGFLWLLFALQTIFPPHDAAFKWAIGSYFFFGIMYGVFAQFIFTFAKHTEQQAIVRAVTHNRSYEWHSHQDPKKLAQTDLKQMSAAVRPQQHRGQPMAVGAGSKGFKYCTLFVVCGIGICLYGIYVFFTTMF